MKSNKLSTLFIIAVSIVSVFFLARTIGAGDDEIKGSVDLQNAIVSPFIYVAYAVFAIIITLTLFFVLRNLLTHKESLKSALVTGGLFLGVVLISFFLSTGTEVVKNGGQVISAYGDRWVGAGIVIFYILAVVAIGSMFFFGIKKTLKN